MSTRTTGHAYTKSHICIRTYVDLTYKSLIYLCSYNQKDFLSDSITVEKKQKKTKKDFSVLDSEICKVWKEEKRNEIIKS